jgi:hypothetical protein
VSSAPGFGVKACLVDAARSELLVAADTYFAASGYDDPVPDDKERIEEALREAGEYVARMPPSAGARELKARLEKLRRAVESWGAIHSPAPSQVDAMIEQANEVRRLATDRAPTMKRRNPLEG